MSSASALAQKASSATFGGLIKGQRKIASSHKSLRSSSKKTITKAAVSVPTTLKSGVVTGADFIDVMNHARHHGYAIPAVNCTMSSVTNACLEAAKVANAPMIIQFSHGGGLNFAGKGLSNEDQKQP